jgi:hypothetical protein
MQSLPKSLFIFIFCVPLAIVFGVMLATPLDRNKVFMVFGGLLLLVSPVLLKYHHIVLILTWNAFINAFFLPGQPYIWMVMTVISSGLLILTSTVNRGKLTLQYHSALANPLIFLFVISIVTAYLTGGFGTRALGSEVYGGKRYVFLWCSIAGFFALSALPIEPRMRQPLAAAFFLVGITAAVSNVAYMLGDNFYFLFLMFPVEWALTQAAAEQTVGGFTRIGGLAPASLAVLSYILLRYGLRGCLQVTKPWRMLALVGSIVACLYSGFRSSFLLMLILVLVQFFIEGLHRTKYLLGFLLVLVMCAVGVIAFADKLPLSAQRCLTILPLDLDRAAIEQAKNSTDWRLDMWRALIPDIPKYFWVGKGYALDPKDMYFSQTHISRRIDAPYEVSLVAGDYHNGPLTLIIPFGIFGVIAFVWFFFAGLRVLRRNLQYGDPTIQNINCFLLTFYIVKMIFFTFIFGAFYLDLAAFTGTVALSLAMNHGIASPAPEPAIAPAAETIKRPVLAWQPAYGRGRLQGT